MLKLTEKDKSRGAGLKVMAVPLRKIALLAALIAGLSGCSSFLNIGSSEYGCSGLPEGVQCMSTSDVYAATNDGQVPRPVGAEVEAEKSGVKTSASTGQNSAVWGSGDTVIDTYVAPRLPNQPIPIRTPAEVMRIWVAPWEDGNGDLNVTGYVYTEIEPRRWVIGDRNSEGSPVLTPLKSAK